MSDKLVILILSYKPMPEWYRAIGLEQCFRVLGRHPIRMVCPIELDVFAYWRIAPALKVDFIPSQWLSSRSEKPLPLVHPELFLYKEELLQGRSQAAAPRWLSRQLFKVLGSRLRLLKSNAPGLK